MLLRHTTSTEARRGVILIVVLALLTLFAIVGLSFVLYAQAEAESSRIYREDKTLRQALESPDRMWGFALSKLLYDEEDNPAFGSPGVYSAIRGHSLARSIYGNDDYYDANNNYVPNQTAFNGTGRLAVAPPLVFNGLTLRLPGNPNPVPLTDNYLVNYTYFRDDPQVALTDRFLRDPERLDSQSYRTDAMQPRRSVTGGINVPYTYPDLNNMFLGAINADGKVLAQSFHRRWLFQTDPVTGLPYLFNDQTNPNWTNAQGKYLTLRPRPVDMSPAFPFPEDDGGDVKNLYWLPGGNDSIWIDIGYPVQVAPDGRKYKPLFAFFITDLDNRINLNVHGNIRGTAGAHVSNQGWGKWEVNVSKVLLPNVVTATSSAAGTDEWKQIFAGVTGNNPPPSAGPGPFNDATIRGRYGWPQTAGNWPVPDDPQRYGPGGNFSSPGSYPHVYGQADFDGGLGQNLGASLSVLLPGQTQGAVTWGPYNCFPGFQAGYDNGNQAERTDHPLIYDFFRPFHDPRPTSLALPPDMRPLIDDRAFSAWEMKELLNGNLVQDPNATVAYGNAPVMAANAMKSQLGSLLHFNFNDPLDIAGSLRRRSLVTTHSMDIDQPGMMPWMWQDAAGNNASGTTYVATQVQPNLRPGDDSDIVSSRAPWGNPSLFPDPTTYRANPIPFNSEFNVPSPPTGLQPFAQSNWRGVTNSSVDPLTGLKLSPLAAIKPILGRLDLSRPLQRYPNQLTDPVTLQPNNYARYDDDNPCLNDPQMRSVRQVYLAAQLDRQVMAADIYRLLRKLCGVKAISSDPPMESDLMPRRWLAQLAVNIVDFIDADDIGTPFNFYPDNEPVTNPPADTIAASNPPPAAPSNPPVLIPGAMPPPPLPVYETLKYWVFGVEMPRVVLNEVFTEYNEPPAAGVVPPYDVTVNVWAELFCTMPPAVAGTWDTTDSNAVRLAVAQGPAAAQTPYAPYRLTIANTVSTANGGPLVPRLNPAGPSPFTNDNVLGTPDQVRRQTDDPNDASTLTFALATVPAPTSPLGIWYTATNGQPTLTAGAGPASIAPPQSPPGPYVIVGPGNNANPDASAPVGFRDQRQSIPSQLPTSTVCVPSQAMSYTVSVPTTAGNWVLPNTTTAIQDNTVGITVLLRRLANPLMPPNNNPLDPQFNPYVTADYLQSVPLSNYANNPTGYSWSYGKLQPYAADPNLVVPQGQTQAPNPLPTPSTVHTLGRQNVWGQQTSVVMAIDPGTGLANPAYPAFDWLVHLDRHLVSPIELLNVSFYHPHELTHRFVVPSQGAALPVPAPPNPTMLPSQWKFKHTGLGPWYDEITMMTRTGAWFDQTTRLYRLLEFVETMDRAYGMSSDVAYDRGSVVINGVTYPFASGVSSIGRRPGKININTVWDLEILQALFDSQQTSNYFSIDDVTTMYNNLRDNRTPGYRAATAAGGNPLQAINPGDRPFLGMAAGHMPYNETNYGFGQNGVGIADTFFRPYTLAQNNLAGDALTGQGRPELPRLFENPNALGANYIPNYNPTAALPVVVGHPYVRFEPLNKVYNNLTTRSNVFGVWATVGYFEVLDDTTRPVRLGAEIGKAAGTNVRHRFFSVVDRTQMVIARNLINSAPGLGGMTPIVAGNPLLGPGQAWLELENAPGGNQLGNFTGGVLSGQQNSPLPGRPPVAWSIGAGSILVVDRGTINEEWVQVLATSTVNPNPMGIPAQSATYAVWIQANFIRPHGPNASITQPGNPGPQPPLDVRDYFHAPVVPVAVTIEPAVR